MNRKLSDFKTFIKGKRTAVLGVGISNKPLIKYIYDLGAAITAFDMADGSDPYISSTRTEFEAAGINIDWSLGDHYLDSLIGFDIIFRTPKVRTDLPALASERDRGTIITSEMEVFLECCPCRTFAITGSDGKTTTSTMVGLILAQEGFRVHLGGNIGTPLLDQIDTIEETDMAVLELSSFQLQSMRRSPDVAVITNITPNHLDVHKDFAEYIDAKKNIFLYQNFMGRLVLNSTDLVSSGFYHEARGEVVFFPAKTGSDSDAPGVSYDNAEFYFPGGRSLPIADIKLLGKHNLDNYCAAVTAVLPYASDNSIIEVMKSFGGVAHRTEFLRTFNGVDYYNSSIDSSPSRTRATLRAFADRGQRVVIIAGGKDKNSDYACLGEDMLKVSDKIILCGQNTPMIKASIDTALQQELSSREISIIEVSEYADAVNKAREIAIPGEAVVLTPAGTSFDRFRNFEERGELFRSLVNQLS
ncbi:MAG: UDP-N-acetylmuramoyl-L-alanine--D-glutamate ligase [Saccharofermentanales bacterium]